MTDNLRAPLRIAVLMPVFNDLAAARRTIGSFDEPALGEVTVLVVDDGSIPPFTWANDAQHENVDSLEAKSPSPSGTPSTTQVHVEVLRLDPNGGIERALAAGVSRLLERGVLYIARIDAGDQSCRNRLFEQAAYLDRHPEVGAVGTWAHGVTPAGLPVFDLCPPTEPASIRRLRFARSCFIHPAMMLRADAVRRAGNYRADYPAAEDLDLFLRIMERDECANLPIFGVRYELNATGISATRRRRQIASLLRLQVRYFSPTNPYDWLGLAKNLAHVVTPYRWLHAVKRRWFRPQDPARLDAPLRICLVSNTAWSIYNYRIGLLRALVAAGVQVIVIAPEDRTFPLLRDMGCLCHPLQLASKSTRPIDDLTTMWDLFRRYRQLRPDAVIHYTIKPNIYGTLAAAFARVASVAVTTGLGYVFLHDNLASRIAQTLYRLAFRFPREVWFLNRDDKLAFEQRGLLAHPERARLLHGEGVDLNHFAYNPLPQNNTMTFLLIGRLLWDKGVGEYVEAASRLREAFPHARWQILGAAGVANPTAIALGTVQKWVADGVIEYLGETDDVRPAIAAADVVVLPSYREGVPRTLLEACALGRPMIATRVPGCVEVVKDNVNGVLCAPRDAADLARAMTILLQMSHRERETMAQAARAMAESMFDEADVVKTYEATLNRISGKQIELRTNP